MALSQFYNDFQSWHFICWFMAVAFCWFMAVPIMAPCMGFTTSDLRYRILKGIAHQGKDLPGSVCYHLLANVDSFRLKLPSVVISGWAECSKLEYKFQFYLLNLLKLPEILGSYLEGVQLGKFLLTSNYIK